MMIANDGGFGTRRQARPNPRTAANLNRKSRVVE